MANEELKPAVEAEPPAQVIDKVKSASSVEEVFEKLTARNEREGLEDAREAAALEVIRDLEKMVDAGFLKAEKDIDGMSKLIVEVLNRIGITEDQAEILAPLKSETGKLKNRLTVARNRTSLRLRTLHEKELATLVVEVPDFKTVVEPPPNLPVEKIEVKKETKAVENLVAKKVGGPESVRIENDPRFKKLVEEVSLEYLKTEDTNWFYKNFSGEISADGYLLDKEGRETNFSPSQNISAGWPEVEAKARAEFARLFSGETSKDFKPAQPSVVTPDFSGENKDSPVEKPEPIIPEETLVKPAVAKKVEPKKPEVLATLVQTKPVVSETASVKEVKPTVVELPSVERVRQDYKWFELPGLYKQISELEKTLADDKTTPELDLRLRVINDFILEKIRDLSLQFVEKHEEKSIADLRQRLAIVETTKKQLEAERKLVKDNEAKRFLNPEIDKCKSELLAIKGLLHAKEQEKRFFEPANLKKVQIKVLLSELGKLETAGDQEKVALVGAELYERYQTLVTQQKEEMKNLSVKDLQERVFDFEKEQSEKVDQKVSPDLLWSTRAKLEAVNDLLVERGEEVNPSVVDNVEPLVPEEAPVVPSEIVVPTKIVEIKQPVESNEVAEAGEDLEKKKAELLGRKKSLETKIKKGDSTGKFQKKLDKCNEELGEIESLIMANSQKNQAA